MPVVLPPLERLSELVERVVVLLDQAPAPAPAAVEEFEPEPAPVARHVLFLADTTGYRLLDREGEAPARGELLDVGGERRRVLRVGPSPLPGDRRRCAFLGEEPPEPTRKPDA